MEDAPRTKASNQRGVTAWHRLRTIDEIGVVVALLSVCVLLTLTVGDKFAQPGNLLQVARQASSYGIMAVGMVLLLAMGQIDLSVGSIHPGEYCDRAAVARGPAGLAGACGRSCGGFAQELNLFPHRTIAANIFANRELTAPGGWVRHRATRDASARVLADLDLSLSPQTLVGSLPLAEKQLVEIARTLAEQSEIIILDEPNSALSEPESVRLFEIIRRLRVRGITMIYISHRLEEVFAIADRITVLRDGRFQGTYHREDTTIPEIIEAMVGRRFGLSSTSDIICSRTRRAESDRLVPGNQDWAIEL